MFGTFVQMALPLSKERPKKQISSIHTTIGKVSVLEFESRFHNDPRNLFHLF